MITNTYFPIRLFLFWLMVFTLARGVFILFLYSNNSELNLSHWPLSFVYGIRLDIAAISYLIAFPILMWIIFLLSKNQFFSKIIHILQVVFIVLVLGILFGNFGIYKAWGTQINARAIAFLQDPEGIIASQTGFQLISRIVLLLLFSFGLYLTFKKFVLQNKVEFEKLKSLKIAILILLLCPLGMRGGWQEIPINESAASFSEVMPLNHAATNPAWYLINNLSKSGINSKNQYKFFSSEEAQKHFNTILTSTEDSVFILNNQRPNIVLIVLESWTADVITPLNTSIKTEITPFFTSLCDSGLLFNSIYSSGRRTDQMFPSILCGFPSPPNHSVARFSDKLQKLPFLSKDLANANYFNSFYYGGELGFANMNSFLLEAKFKSISGKENYKSEQIYSKWGAHDEHLFTKVLEEMDKKPQPFFTMLLTLSTHEPFDVPEPPKFAGEDESDKFKNAAYYTDRCLKDFFEKAKKTKCYNNTIFILVADHGHLLPEKRDYYDPRSYHIPLLWYGEPIKNEFKGKQVARAGGQHEIAFSLLHQMNLESKDYIYSNDLFTSKKSKGVYLNYDNGFCWKENEEQFVYLFEEKRYLPSYTHINKDSVCVLNGKSYLQILYQGFLDL